MRRDLPVPTPLGEGRRGYWVPGPRTARRERKGSHRWSARIIARSSGSARSRPLLPPRSQGSPVPRIRARSAPITQPQRWRPLAAGLSLHARPRRCLQACAPLGPSARNVSPSLAPPPRSRPYTTTQVPEPHPLSSSDSQKDWGRGSDPLENSGIPSRAHSSWRRLDKPQGVFVPVLPHGPELCPPRG